MNIGKRVVEIVIKATDGTSSAFGGMGKRIAELSQKFPALSVVAGLALNKIIDGFGRMASAVVGSYQGMIRLGDSLNDMSKRTDASVESLSKWAYVTKLGGSSLDEFETAFRKLRKTMADAVGNSAEAIAIFERLGVAFKNADGSMRDVEAVMLDIGEVLSQHSAASVEAAAAQDAMGRSSAAFNSVLRQGREVLKLQTAEAKVWGGELSKQFVDMAAKSDDAAVRLETAWKSVQAGLTPALASITESLGILMIQLKGDMPEAIRVAWEAEQEFRKNFKLFDESKINAGADAMWAAISGLKDRSTLEGVAKDFGVAVSETVFDPKANKWVNQDRTAEAIAADLTAAMAKVPDKIADAMSPEKVTAAIDLDLGTIGTDEVTLLEDYAAALELVRTGQEEMDAAGPPAIMDPEVIAAGDEALQRLIESAAQAAEEQEILYSAGQDLKYGFQNLASSAIQAFAAGEAGAMRFGTMLRQMVVQVIAEAIAKFLVLKAIAFFTGGIGGLKHGGAVTPMAIGGQIPRAALGYAVPDGPRGMDSRLIAAMPGEEVINRQLSQRMDRFLSSMEFGAAVSPFAMSGAGGGRGNVIVNFEVGRPVSVLDSLSYGEAATTAARKVSEANL